MREMFSTIGRWIGLGDQEPDPAKDPSTLSATIQVADNMKSMAQSPGWKIVEVCVQERILLLQQELDTAEFKSLKQVARLQGQISELKYVLGIPGEVVSRGQAARETLEEVSHG